MANPVTKRKRGRPAKSVALQHKSETTLLDQFEQTVAILPDLFNELRRISLDPQARQQLTAIKQLLELHDKFLGKLQEEEKEEVSASEQQQTQPEEDNSILSKVSWEYEEAETEAKRH